MHFFRKPINYLVLFYKEKSLILLLCLCLSVSGRIRTNICEKLNCDFLFLK